MITVMMSGHFDPLHDMHLDYIKQAKDFGDYLVCVVSSDKQLLLKKGKVNIPEQGRVEIATLILKGLGIKGRVVLNIFDTETTLVAKALQCVKPDVFCRGGDKKLGDMPIEEQRVCKDLNIEVQHAKFYEDRHGSRMML